MKFTKLSLVAALAVSAAVAGGDIAPVEAPVVVPEYPQTSIAGKLTGYYITYDQIINNAGQEVDMFSGDSSQLGLAATLDVTHKFNANIALNFSAVGYANMLNETALYFEEAADFDGKSGAFMNVANITASYMDTTFILGRQLLNTPMLSGFDWLLAPGAFEAYTFANSSIENVTFIGSYVNRWRINNTGDNWVDLGDLGEDSHNWTLSAGYDDKTISGSLWYYNIDAMDYTQVYVDGAYDFGAAKIYAQYANTDWNNAEASNVFGAKVTGTAGAFSLMAAYVNVSDNLAGWVGLMDGLYTSSWNTATGGSLGNNFKVEAAAEFAGISSSVSYAYYEYDQNAIAGLEDDGQEIDVILGYNITDSIDTGLVYTNTDYGEGDGQNGLEIFANYKF